MHRIISRISLESKNIQSICYINIRYLPTLSPLSVELPSLENIAETVVEKPCKAGVYSRNIFGKDINLEKV